MEPTTYQGLTLGKSKKSDVERIFGQPVWSGHPEDPYDNAVPSLISYEYDDVGGFNGMTAVIMNRRTGVVSEIVLTVDYKRRITLQEIISKYGRDYVQIDDGLGPCPSQSELKRYRKPETPSGVFLSYASKGLYVHIDYEEKVQEIVFLKQCP
jgi:hypothetical protein